MADEGIRAAVSIEMLLSGDYIQPTVWGEPYYYKTPLYNWILALFMKLFGYSEFVFRLPSVLSLFGLGYLSFQISKKALGKDFALFAALTFILSGRLLSRDSMLGHIDLFYSLVTFLQFYVIYYFWEKKQFLKLFVVSYLLMSAGVLMKGLPSIAFQGISLLTWFIAQKDWKKLLSLQHFAGLAAAALIIGSYFWIYASGGGSQELYFERLYQQSAERTFLYQDLLKSLFKVFSFPFENLAHLFPTSVFFIFLFRKKLVTELRSNSLIWFLSLIFVANLIPYWLSPGYYPRYLFMLYPIPFILSFYALKKLGMGELSEKFLRIFWISLAFLMVLTFLLAPFFFDLSFQANIPLLLGFLTLIAISLIILQLRQSIALIPFALSMLVLFRLAFDLLVIPYRVEVEAGDRVQQKTQAMKVSALTRDAELLVWPYTPLTENYAFYFGSQKNQIIRKSYDYKSGQYFLMPAQTSSELKLSPIYSFNSGYENIVVDLVLIP